MCGRYSLTTDLRALEDRFSFKGNGLQIVPREQVYPTNDILTVIQPGAGRIGMLMHWGFLPVWSTGRPLINAQAEKLALSNTWRRPLAERRCLVLADSYYEWQKNPDSSKTMLKLARAEGTPFALAGLWGEFENKRGQRVPCATIVTTAAAGVIAQVHDRMPVALSQEAEALWLDPQTKDSRTLHELLTGWGQLDPSGWSVRPYVAAGT